MANIRFQNLPKLLQDMDQSGWTITAFAFHYKHTEYAVILKLYGEDDRRPSEHAKASLEFCRRHDLTASIFAYLDYYEVRFFSTEDFCRFFDVQPSGELRDMFLDFSEIFANSIPPYRPTDPPKAVRDKMISRCEGDDPNAIYCYDVRRNGLSPLGVQKHRRASNGTKAALAVPWLWDKLRADDTISFCFTANIDQQRTEAEIFEAFLEREGLL